MPYEVRKWWTAAEEVLHDGGPDGEPLRKVVAAVVFRNPCADRYVPDLDELIEPSGELGTQLATRAISLLGGCEPESYGKGGVAGTAGEQEHVVACVTTVFGDALRAAVGGGTAWVSSTTKVGAPGEQLDLPLAYKDALYVRSHYDTVTLRIPDAPRPDELVIAVALASGGRVHHRVGGLTRSQAAGDGLR
jgi:hypothetical protein